MDSYEMRELAMFRKQMEEVEKLPLAERKENAVEWFKDLSDNYMMVAERVGWLLNGSYGKGSFDSACRVVNSPRMNQVAWCAITIANLEWRCPAKMAIMAWKKLSVEKRYLVNEAIRREIADAKAEGYCGEIKKNGYQPYEFTTTPHRDLRPETRAYLARVPMIRLHNQRKGIVVKTLPANSPKWTEKQKKNIATLLEISTSNRDNISLGDEVYEKFYA